MNRNLTVGMAMVVLSVTWPQLCPAQANESRVRDGAGLFSNEAVRQAERVFRDGPRGDDRWQVVIETVESLRGEPIEKRALANAKAARVRGLYVLIAKEDHKVWIEPSNSARGAFPKERVQAIRDAIVRAFRAQKYDQGLQDAVALIHGDRSRPARGAREPATSGVKDGAKLFSGEAVREAERLLRRDSSPGRPQVVIETIESLDGKSPEEAARDRAEKADVRGLYVLIAQEDHKVWVQPRRSSEFPRAKVQAVTDAITDAFKARRFDTGLLDAVAAITGHPIPAPSTAATPAPGPSPTIPKAEAPRVEPPPGETPKSEAPAAAPSPPAALEPTRPEPSPTPRAAVAEPPAEARRGNNLLLIGGLAVGAVLLVWVLSRAFRRSPAATTAATPPPSFAMGGRPVGSTGPGPGAPTGGPAGYGPGPGYPAGGYGSPPASGGGGFMSGMLGGLGGAVLGNVLYDQFGRPHGHGSQVPHPAPPHDAAATGPIPSPEPASETYDPSAGAGGDWGPPPEPAGAGGDWGEATVEPGAGGDWGGDPVADADAGGGDWGGDDTGGGGGDWGGDSGGDSGGDGGSW